MSEDYSTALTLLAVGMITVFVILGFIVLFGNILILITNKFFPAPIPTTESPPSPHNIHPKKLAAIIAAVNTVTNGKGKVESIEKK